MGGGESNPRSKILLGKRLRAPRGGVRQRRDRGSLSACRKVKEVAKACTGRVGREDKTTLRRKAGGKTQRVWGGGEGGLHKEKRGDERGQRFQRENLKNRTSWSFAPRLEDGKLRKRVQKRKKHDVLEGVPERACWKGGKRKNKNLLLSRLPRKWGKA